MKTHLLQSHAWESYSKLEGHATFWLEGKDFTALAVKYSTPLGSYLYCPYGPSLDETDSITSLEHSVTALKKLAREQNCFFLRLEPIVPFSSETMTSHGFVKSHDLQPAHTWAIDLTQPEDDILKALEKRKLKKWRNHQKNGLTLRLSQDPNDVAILSGFLASLGSRNHFNPQEEDHLRNQLKSGFATLYIADYDGQPIGAALFCDHDGVRYSTHAASSPDHQNLAVGTVIAVQAIVDAKAKGFHTYDFWGITTSDDPKHPWYGFTQYKKTFGGHQVDYTGTWDLPLNRAKYRLYLAIRHLNRLLRHK